MCPISFAKRRYIIIIQIPPPCTCRRAPYPPPCTCRRASRQSLRPAWAARRAGLSPSLLVLLTLIWGTDSSRERQERWPALAAQCRAVLPAGSVWLTGILLARHSLTSSVLPLLAASWRGLEELELATVSSRLLGTSPSLPFTLALHQSGSEELSST